MAIPASNRKTTSKGEACSFLAFLSYSISATANCFLRAMRRKLGLSKLRSDRTFIDFIEPGESNTSLEALLDFSLQYELELED